jgi:hypothetical protein
MANIMVRTSAFHHCRNTDPIRVTTRDGASPPLTTAAVHPCTPPQQYGAVNHGREVTNEAPDLETRLPTNSHEGYSNCTRMRGQF